MTVAAATERRPGLIAPGTWQVDLAHSSVGFRVKRVGDLTIRGITKPVELTGSVEGVGRDPWGNDRVGLELGGELDRREFGLTWNQASRRAASSSATRSSSRSSFRP